MVLEVSEAFDKADFPQTLRLLDKHFKGSTYSLKSLFRDQQRKTLGLILESTLRDVDAVYRNLYEQNAPIMQFLRDSDSPPPKALSAAAELVINADLQKALEDENPDVMSIRKLLEKARLTDITLDEKTLEYAFRQGLRRIAEKLHADPLNLSILVKLVSDIGLLDALPFQINIWMVQNICYEILQSDYPDVSVTASHGDKEAKEWINQFLILCERISVRT
jgi:hypothetical protein